MAIARPSSLSSAKAAKKRKLKHDSTKPPSRSVQELEAEIQVALENNTSLNALADLFQLAETTEAPQKLLKVIYALYRVFTLAIRKQLLTAVADEAAERKTVRVWLTGKFEGFVEILCSLLADSEAVLRSSSLQILFSLLKETSTAASQASGSAPPFNATLFKKTVSALLVCPSSSRQTSASASVSEGILREDVRDAFARDWLNKYCDIRWYFLREAANLLSSEMVKANPSIVPNALSILEKLTSMPSSKSDLNTWWIASLGKSPPKKKGENSTANEEEAAAEDAEEADDWRTYFDEPAPKETDGPSKKGRKRRVYAMTIHEQLHSVEAHRAVFTKCWLALLSHISVLRGDTEGEQSEELSLVVRTLNTMHRLVMPHLTRAIMIMDWVTDCVDVGSGVGLLALNTLFILMQEYQLDYPQFYTRLYAFLDRDILHLKHRARFFRLTEAFLSSTHLPATLLASFVKRLSRLSLSAPPAAIIMIVPFVYNILKRHPALMVMIHRTDANAGSEDPFDAKEPNPTLTNALESSLWELYSHKCHYHSGVSTLVKILGEAFTKPNYAMEDFLDHTYGTLSEAEYVRKVVKPPPTADSILKNSPSGQAPAMSSLWEM